MNKNMNLEVQVGEIIKKPLSADWNSSTLFLASERYKL